ncbi:MAG: hypothetical protein WAS90_03635 [Brachymonas denitrificans]
MAWRALGYTSQALYVVLRRRLTATNNGNINAELGGLKHYGWNAPATLSKNLRELQAVGLIAKTRQGGIARSEKVCNLFRFTDEPVFEQPKLNIPACKATNEWQQFKTLKEAKQAIAEAHQAARRGGNTKQSGLQKLKPATSNIEVGEGFTASNIEHVTPARLQKLNTTKGSKSAVSQRPH